MSEHDSPNATTPLYLSAYLGSCRTSSGSCSVTRHITNVPGTRGWERKIAEGPPCVVLASPGFMNSGPSRELLELWAPDSKNGLIVTGYSVEGTMARVSGYHVRTGRYRRRVPQRPCCMYNAKQWTCFLSAPPFPLFVSGMGRLFVSVS